jgi:hypothetical protein
MYQMDALYTTICGKKKLGNNENKKFRYNRGN